MPPLLSDAVRKWDREIPQAKRIWLTTASPQKSGATLESGQYRNAVASGLARATKFLGYLCHLTSTRRYRVSVLTRSNVIFDFEQSALTTTKQAGGPVGTALESRSQ